jgi:glycosyltransferase involved in cell wall biosynthesis
MTSPKFTICIPSYNRGQAALRQVLHTLPMVEPDWEILVLDNCSFRSLQGYSEIQALSKSDRRIRYIKHIENLGFHGNILSCLKLANSPYLQILSDEDYANISVIHDAIATLAEFPQAGLIRGSIGAIEGMKPRNSKIYPDQFLDAGRAALADFSFTTSYLSGIIYNRELLAARRIIERLEHGLRNNPAIAPYAHMYLDILISSCAVVITSTEIVCFEGEEDNDVADLKSTAETFTYTFPGRLQQFIGFRDALREVCGPDDLSDLPLLVHLYKRLVDKYWLLFSVDGFLYTSRGLRLDDLSESLKYFFQAASGFDEFASVREMVRVMVDDCCRDNLQRLNWKQ